MRQTRIYVLASLLFAGMALYAQAVQEMPEVPVTSTAENAAVAAEKAEASIVEAAVAAEEAELVTAETSEAAALAAEEATLRAEQAAAKNAKEAVALEQIAAEKEELERLRQERQAAEQTENDRLAAEREQIAAEKAELERLHRERIEREQARAAAAKAKKQRKAEAAKEPLFQRFYSRNGRNALSLLSFGYNTYFRVGQPQGVSGTAESFRRHILNMEILEFRTGIFGMQLLNFELGINTPSANPTIYQFERGGSTYDTREMADAKTMWFAYKPAIKFYIPCTQWMAVEVYGGAEVDLTKGWSFIYKGYYTNPNIPDNNFFVNAYGGLGLMFYPIAQVPVEVKAEYRHPVMGNTALVPQGIYLTFQVHFAVRTRKN